MKNEQNAPIVLFPIDRRIEKYRLIFQDAFFQVLDSGNFILGRNLVEFESNFAEYLGAEFCLGVANGTDAIEIALRSIELPPNSLVATVANAGNYATTSIIACQHIPIYLDIDVSTQLTNFDFVKQAIALGAKAIILTHLYGAPIPDLEEIVNLCHTHEVKLIEDCAQAHGANIRGKKVGTFGDISTFSFYPTKNLGGLGDGGAVVTNNSELAKATRKLRNYGWGEKYNIEIEFGRNSRLDDIQAAILNKLLPWLDEENAERKRFVDYFKSEVKNSNIDFLKSKEGSVHHLLVILTQHRLQLANYLASLGIHTGIHYPIIDVEQIGRSRSTKVNNLVHTIESSKQILTLPLHPYLSDNEVRRITNALNSFNPETSLPIEVPQ